MPHIIRNYLIIGVLLNKAYLRRGTPCVKLFYRRAVVGYAPLPCARGGKLRLYLAYKRCFAPYPFILLNLVLSCVAAIQAPLIMMSQNRQEEKDRRRAENDYKVNLKTEIMIEDLHDKMNKIIAKQVMLEKLIRGDKNNNDKEE